MFSRIALLAMLACGFLASLSSCQKEQPAKQAFELSQQTEFEDVSLNLQISQSSLKTNESAQVSLSIKHAPGLEITLPDLEGQLGEWTISERTSEPAKLDSQSWTHYQLNFEIEPDLPGETPLPSIVISVEDEAGKIREVSTKSVSIEVLSVGVDADTQLRDIAPDERDSTQPSDTNQTPAWLLSALIVGAIGVIILRKSKRSSEPVKSAAMADFRTLAKASTEEIACQLEPAFCKAFAERSKLTNPSSDFTNLCRELATPPARLILLASRYESLQYGKQSGSNSEIAALYQECEELLNDNVGEELES